MITTPERITAAREWFNFVCSEYARVRAAHDNALSAIESKGWIVSDEESDACRQLARELRGIEEEKPKTEAALWVQTHSCYCH